MAKKRAAAPAAEKKAMAVSTTIDIGADVGAGMEGTTTESFAIPFLRVLQKGSPECDDASGRVLKGAKPGALLNTVTSELFPGGEGLLFIPCAYQRRFLRWAPRGSSSQGFRGEMLPEEVAELRQNDKLIEHEGRLYFPLEDGSVNEKRCDRAQDTRNHFGCVLGANGAVAQVLLSLTSTQIKKSKMLMSLLAQQKVSYKGQLVTAPTFLNVIRITTVPEANDKGSWFGVHFALEGRVESKEIYAAAQAFHGMIAAGKGRVDYEQAADDAAELADDGKF